MSKSYVDAKDGCYKENYSVCDSARISVENLLTIN